jgi:hypothetical protein
VGLNELDVYGPFPLTVIVLLVNDSPVVQDDEV